MSGGRHRIAGGGGPIASASREALAAAAAQRRSLAATAHRPWPVPAEPWVLGQSWERLLFAHWRVAADALRAHVPPPLRLDTFDGTAWLGVTPFAVAGLHPRGVPPLGPWAFFLEVNVRTYVVLDDRPGILFLSLDASRRLTAAAARVTHRLPYHLADMRAGAAGDAVRYRSARRWRGPPARLDVTYRGVGDPAVAEPGSLTAFLVERYRLYTADAAGRLWLTDIHHAPWRVRAAEAELCEATLVPPGLEIAGEPPLLHLAEPQHTVSWLPRPAPV
jgi:uncharacterized protein